MIPSRLIAAVYGQPWNMEPMEWYARLHQPIVTALKKGEPIARESAETTREPLAKRPTMDGWGNPIAQMNIVKGVATIPVHGILVSGATPYEKKWFDIADYADIHDDIDTALREHVHTIDFDVNSPGGSVLGLAEVANRVAELRSQGIIVTARTAGLMCSAAYYLSAGARKISATPSAWVGSIGTIWETINVADLLAEIGIEWTVFTSGPLKGTGHPAKKLTDAQRDYMQDMVNTLAGEFKGHVRAFRSRVQDSAMQGQAMLGSQAAAVGLVDALLPR